MEYKSGYDTVIKHVGSVENGRSSIVRARKGEKCDATSLLSCTDRFFV